jgi:hypothetical protein
MEIGEPKRIREVRPVTVRLPETVPLPERDPAPPTQEPVHEPEGVPAR